MSPVGPFPVFSSAVIPLIARSGVAAGVRPLIVLPLLASGKLTTLIAGLQLSGTLAAADPILVRQVVGRVPPP